MFEFRALREDSELASLLRAGASIQEWAELD